MAKWIVYGSELSPFALKVRAMCRSTGLPHQFFTREASTWEAARVQLRKELLVRGYLQLTWPQMTAEDEFPLVPFLFGPDGENLYDSTAIGYWLDEQSPVKDRPGSLIAREPEPVRAAIAVIDEYADEWGLYLAHHHRWVVSARSCNAASRLVDELPPIVRLGRARIERFFTARQVRRLPYLFSFAPPGLHIAGLPAYRQPPSRPGFPPTHELLEDALLRLLAALEPVLQRRPFLFGSRFTLADASLYGQLAMNLEDPEASALIAARAPHTHAWLRAIYKGEFPGSEPGAPLSLHEDLRPLFTEIGRTFIPLMQQQLRAYERYRAAGGSLYNEAAFDAGQGLYDGELDGRPFRHVVKSFQVKTWRNLQPHLSHPQLRDLLNYRQLA
ncbi:MAG TPA: glutathione S-transferase C-terminal domain-containing protein [Pseudomonadota bacterium]|nr:glutathione S-transferase C-terminal domain-containing protein [Pseudomonadota bacterium]